MVWHQENTDYPIGVGGSWPLYVLFAVSDWGGMSFFHRLRYSNLLSDNIVFSMTMS